MTALHVESITLPGARLGDENPLPFFRDPAVDTRVKVDDTVPAAKQALFGRETAFRVLPYRMQDQYTRQKAPLTFRGLVLENEFLKATFLPEMGGRLISLLYMPLNQELLHRNPVFQPANLAIRNAWFSGGIEWNIAQFGHTFNTCSPLFASAITGEQGEPGLRLYEYERCRGLFWQIDFYLPPGFPFLVAYTRVVNPGAAETGMYWWTNIAVNEAPGVRVLSPAQDALYIKSEGSEMAFGSTHLPGLPSLGGADGTYALNSTFANEFFFQCDSVTMPWEAALDAHGRGFIEASTARLRYRKLFVWGSHAGGRHWQEFLSAPGQAYLEIQAGLAPTQLHGLTMPARTTWDWTQVFGYLEADPARVHGADWQAACGAVETALRQRLPAEKLAGLEMTCRKLADRPAVEILQYGAGWGALEIRRRSVQTAAAAVPAAFEFPGETLGPEQKKWLALLEDGALPEPPPSELPGEWMVQSDWRALLERSAQDPANCTWFTLLHLGVMRLEAFDAEGAAAAWEESIQVKPSVWAYRNLAVLRLRQKDAAAAQEYYRLAWQQALHDHLAMPALAAEYLQLLVELGQFEQGKAVYEELPDTVRSADRVQILHGKIALELGDLDAVEAVLGREFAVIREGETMLTDLWFEVQARRLAQARHIALSPELLRDVKQHATPPARIDFRAFTEM